MKAALGNILLAHVLSFDSTLVERGPEGKAPTAFRIWNAGEVRCDDESIFFTEESAKLLMKEQEDRNRIYSSDYDHLSLMTDRPATAGMASGWHKLEIRKDAAGNPELWAVDVQWTAEARAGLDADVPLWRYFSPAFKVNKDNEVVSYTNLALCINPLTRNIPSLASIGAKFHNTSGVTAMDKDKAFAILANAESSEDDKKEALAYLKAAMDDGEKDDKDKENAEGDSDSDKEEDKDKAAAKLASDNLKMKARLDAMERKELLAARTDLDASVKGWLETQTVDQVRSFLASVPIQVLRNASPTAGDVQVQEAAKKMAEEAQWESFDRAWGVRKLTDEPMGLGPVRNGVRTLVHANMTSKARPSNEKKGA